MQGMLRRSWGFRVLLLIGLSVSGVVVRAQPLDYGRDIQPIFEARCVACHACFDAPCQLKLNSAEGLLRGASKQPVYDGQRTETVPTTRLFVDAHSEADWRDQGFHSVQSSPLAGQAGLLERMLQLGQTRNHYVANGRLPDDLEIGIHRTQSCPRPDEFDDYAARQPQAGMPFAVTGLAPGEYATLQQWLQQGAPVTVPEWQAPAGEAEQISAWETFFNQSRPRERLVSRWLFEHLFLAHLYFGDGSTRQFYQLVRSRTPSGEPIEPIATRRPNGDPGRHFFYRLQPIRYGIVHKTHITFGLNPGLLSHVRQLMLGGDWTLDSVPGYGAYHRANPFRAFGAIPPRIRYQFMLEHAEYFVRTFTRGPVCRGQLATDVIRDRFWVLFQAPEQDLYLIDADYRTQVDPHLALPGLYDSLTELLSVWEHYSEKRARYADLRREAYRKRAGPDWSHIWQGNDNALLTVFRQHDSASVHKGLIGAEPLTYWLMDFPLLERTYYQLVVNFDVFGNLSHQLQTRLYFDLIRNGSEQNFLRLMPAAAREALQDDWYQEMGQLRVWFDYPELDEDTPTRLQLPSEAPKTAFTRQLLHRLHDVDAARDPLNRCTGPGCHRAELPEMLALAEQALARLTSIPAGQLPVIGFLPETTILRIEDRDGRREIYSLLRNRAHSNVAFMLGESWRFEPELDTLTLYPGVLSSYPNFMFSVPVDQVSMFVVDLQQARTRSEFERIAQRWGIRRTHPQFWEHFHDISRYLQETRPVEAGILDMNRYENL